MRKKVANVISAVLCAAMIVSPAAGPLTAFATENSATSETVLQQEEEREAAGGLRFINSLTGEAINPEYVAVYDDYKIDGGYFTFPSLYAGDTISYSVSEDGYETVSGEYTLSGYSYDLEVSMEKIPEPEGHEEDEPESDADPYGQTEETETAEDIEEMELSVGYMEGSLSLAEKLPEGYDGASYSVESGEDVVEVSPDGTVLLKNAGNAVIAVHAGSRTLYTALTVEKAYIGIITSDDIKWEDVTKQEDGEKSVHVKGTISENAGIRSGDTVRVTAIAQAASAFPGTHSSTLTDVILEGDENYDIRINEAGPIVTITENGNAGEAKPRDAEEKVEGRTEVTAAFEGGTPANEGFFSSNRTMEVRIAVEDYDEKLALFEVSVDGNEMSGTISDVRSGNLEGVELISECLTGDNGAVYKLLFGGRSEDVEASYKVKVFYGDTEAVYGGESPTEFVIDEIAPVLDVEFRNGDDAVIIPGASAEEPIYETSKMTAVLSVTDRFFDQRGAEVDVRTYDAAGNTTGAYPASSADAVKNGEWIEKEDRYSFAMVPFTEESNYEVSVSYTDLAGNPAEPVQDKYFTIDRSAPEGSVAVTKKDGSTVAYEDVLAENASGSGVVSRLFSRISGSRYVTLEDNYSDSTSGVSSAQYALAENADEADFEAADWKDWNGDVRVDTKRVAVILEKVTDKAGHTAYFASDRETVVEVKEPAAPVITIKNAENTSSGGAEIEVNVQEPDNGGDGTYAGIRSMRWTVTDPDGTTVLSGEETSQGQEKELDKTITLSEDEITSDIVTVSVTAEDNAGNTASASKTLSLTSSSMSITSSMDMYGVSNGHYFNTKRTVTVIYGGKDFDPSNASLTVNAGGKEVSFTMEELENGSGADAMIRFNSHTDSQKGAETYTDERANTYEFFFGAGENVDIDYEGLRFTSTDAVNNEISHKAEPADFTVDTVKPVLAVTYTENGKNITEKVTEDAENTHCGTFPVIVSASVRERSFDPAGTVFTVTARDSKGNTISDAYPKELTDAAGEDWTVTGTASSKQFAPFEKEANYSVMLQVTDLAGNKSEEEPAGCFSVDKTQPDGKITVTADGNSTEYTDSRENIFFSMASKDGFSVSCEPDDLISGTAKVEYLVDTPDITLTGDFKAKTQEELQDMEWTEWENNKEGKPEELTIAPDRQAVLYARVTDKAGNTFILHTDGLIADSAAPAAGLNLSQPAGTIYSGSITADVSGTDPVSGGTYSGIKEVRVTVTTGGNVIQEKTFTGSSLKERVRDVADHLQVDTQKINTNDAVITVSAEDNAGNTGSISTSLMVDSTLPAISTDMDVSDVKNERYFNKTKTMTVRIVERNFDPGQAYMYFMDGNTRRRFSMTQLSGGDATGYGISVTKSTDSQAGWEVKDLTDERVVTYDIAFGDRAEEDTLYKDISFEIADIAGNRASHKPEMDTFTVDKVKPVIDIAYRIDLSDVTDRITTDESLPFCTKKPVTVAVTVNEKNFYGNGMSADVTSRDHDGNETGAYTGADNIKEGWRRDGNICTNTLPLFSNDSNYGLAIECKDLAGNTAKEYPFHYFTIDTTPPSGEIVVYDGDGNEHYDHFSETAVFRHVSKEPIRVGRNASDATSGIASVRYFRYTPPVNTSGRFYAMTLDGLRKVDWKDWGEEYTVNPDSQAVIYARLADRAGNILYISTEGAMIADSTDPSYPEITITAAEPSEGIYAGDVPVSIRVQDPVSGGTYSGLRNVTVQVLNGGSVTQEASYAPGKKADRVRSFSTSVTVDAEKNNSNYVRVRTIVQDWAGNRISAEKELSIDITAPRIEVAYDRNDPANGKYYNSARTATITVYERNFNPSRVNLSVGGGSARISGWTIGSEAGSSDNNPNTCTIVYEADSDYTFTMDLTDKAGNYASYGQTDSFTVDTTAPVITVTYDNNNGRGRYYNQPRTATILVEDANFDPDLFSAQIQAMLEDHGITAPQVSSWTSSGNSHSATISFDTDGDYSFTLSCRDLAENPAQDYHSDSFTIDLTAPEVTITGIKDHSANRGEAVAVIEFSDINFDPEGVVIRLSGLKHEAKNVEGTFEQAARGGTVALADFEHVITEDDIYTLTAFITDRAGNVTEKSITFSINRFGSNFYFDDPTEGHLEQYYGKEPFQLVIYETNVNAVVDRDIIIYRNGETMTLGDDEFTVEDVSEKDDWKRYRYTVSETVFSEEGVYEVLVSSVDEAGNRQDNKTKNAPVAFIIDKTAPSAVITGAENGSIYNSTSRSVVVEVTDNYAVGEVEVFLNREVYGRYDATSIGEMDGRIPVDIKESSSWQTVTASVIDAAGNESVSDDMVVLVTTDPFTRFVNNKVFRMFVFGMSLAAVIALVLFLIWKNRKKEEK